MEFGGDYWYNTEETLEDKVVEFRSNPKLLARLFAQTLSAYENQSDFFDLWGSDEVAQIVIAHVLNRIPAELPSSLLRPVCGLFSAMYDENIAEELVRMDWAEASIQAISRYQCILRLIPSRSILARQVSRWTKPCCIKTHFKCWRRLPTPHQRRRCIN